MIAKIHLVAVTLWLGLVCFTDIIAIPTVFKTLGNPDLAGQVGLTLFSKLNAIEVLLCGAVLVTGIKLFPGWRVLGAGFLSIITMAQAFYITPQIKELAHLLMDDEKVDSKLKLFNTLHEAYIYLDYTKILILCAVFVLAYSRVDVTTREPKTAEVE